MQMKRKIYPYPVLAPDSDDIVECEFKTTLENVPMPNSYRFKAKFSTTCQYFNDLIQSKRAYFAVHIECAGTRYREMLRFYKNEHELAINSEDVEGTVQLCEFIIAAEDIPNYQNPNANPDYGDVIFNIKKGDILAVGLQHKFTAHKEFDPLRKMSSIFTIGRNTQAGADPIDIEISNYKIIIKLAEDNFERYQHLKKIKELQPVLAASLVLPALVSVIEDLKRTAGEQYTEWEGYKWFGILIKRMQGLGLNLVEDSSIKIANKLIGDPVSSGLVTLTDQAEEME